MALGKRSSLTGLTVILMLSASLSACSNTHQLPYPYWYVGLAAPRYMEVWVEGVDVVDQHGLVFYRVHGGVSGYTSKPEGWHDGGGAAKPLNNIGLPERILLRWQSLVEPQTYHVSIEIPQWVRDEMIIPKRVFCPADQAVVTVFGDRINLGMAPGGIVKAWVGSGCVGYKEIGRFQASVDPRGPYKGKSKGRYIRLEPENKAYIEKHGIPYGSWWSTKGNRAGAFHHAKKIPFIRGFFHSARISLRDNGAASAAYRQHGCP